jgi:RNA polymerase sigma-70 factor (ECF subfamily)
MSSTIDTFITTTPNSVPHVRSSFDFYQDTTERPLFDQDYLNRLRGGDQETERHFAHYFGERLVKKVRCRFHSCQLAEDARQETLLRVLHFIRTKGRIQYPQRLGAFVNGVCENVVSEFFRASRRHPQAPEHVPEPFEQAASAELDLLLKERKAIIHAVLNKLSQTDQIILRKAFLEECDYDQICRELGMGRNNLRVRIHRALVRFRVAIRNGEAAELEFADRGRP